MSKDAASNLRAPRLSTSALNVRGTLRGMTLFLLGTCGNFFVNLLGASRPMSHIPCSVSLRFNIAVDHCMPYERPQFTPYTPRHCSNTPYRSLQWMSPALAALARYVRCWMATGVSQSQRFSAPHPQTSTIKYSPKASVWCLEIESPLPNTLPESSIYSTNSE